MQVPLNGLISADLIASSDTRSPETMVQLSCGVFEQTSELHLLVVGSGSPRSPTSLRAQGETPQLLANDKNCPWWGHRFGSDSTLLRPRFKTRPGTQTSQRRMLKVMIIGPLRDPRATIPAHTNRLWAMQPRWAQAVLAPILPEGKWAQAADLRSRILRSTTA